LFVFGHRLRLLGVVHAEFASRAGAGSATRVRQLRRNRGVDHRMGPADRYAIGNIAVAISWATISPGCWQACACQRSASTASFTAWTTMDYLILAGTTRLSPRWVRARRSMP
jgi:hypothetical protein